MGNEVLLFFLVLPVFSKVGKKMKLTFLLSTLVTLLLVFAELVICNHICHLSQEYQLCMQLCILKKGNCSPNTGWCRRSGCQLGCVSEFPLSLQVGIHAQPTRELQRSGNPGGPAKSQRLGALTRIMKKMDLLPLSHCERTGMPANQPIQTAVAWCFPVSIYNLTSCLNYAVDLLELANV